MTTQDQKTRELFKNSNIVFHTLVYERLGIAMFKPNARLLTINNIYKHSYI